MNATATAHCVVDAQRRCAHVLHAISARDDAQSGGSIVPLSRTTTDHEEIRNWVEERGGMPAAVKATERRGDPGILRIDFPGYSGEGRLDRIEWDEFFRKFDESGLAFVYQERT